VGFAALLIAQADDFRQLAQASPTFLGAGDCLSMDSAAALSRGALSVLRSISGALSAFADFVSLH
jgi:hypothetical protein